MPRVLLCLKPDVGLVRVTADAVLCGNAEEALQTSWHRGALATDGLLLLMLGPYDVLVEAELGLRMRIVCIIAADVCSAALLVDNENLRDQVGDGRSVCTR